MLSYLLRTAPVLASAYLHRDGRLTSRIQRRVRLLDIDVNLHMNQATYLQVMELGRMDWIIRSGAWTRWRSEGINPVVAEQRVVYRRELKPLQRYAVDTRATSLDGRLLSFEHVVLVDDRVHAINTTKMIFVGSKGVLSVQAATQICEGLLAEPLPIDDWRVRA